MKQKVFFGISLCSLLVLTGCVSEQSYIGSDKPVSDRTFDNIEAARTRISLGLNYLRRGDTSQAKYNLERARSFAPNSAEVYSALAYYYQSVGEVKFAEEHFRQAISKDRDYADAYNNFGAFLCQQQRYDEAEQLLLKAISRPGYIRVAESYENLALCKIQQNQFNKANEYLEHSISHNSTRITSLTMLAGIAYAMGDNRQAKLQLDRIQRLGRVSARTTLLSYLIAEKSGDRETMRNAEQLLLTLYTDTPETRLLLQGKVQDSEFEQLRERYKDSLMANIVQPDDDAVKPALPSPPVPNPKLKVVKRKTDIAQSAPASASVPVAAPLSNATADIASALDSGVVTNPVTAAALPTEQIKTDNSYDKLAAEQQAAELVAEEQLRLAAEREAAELAAQEQLRLAAEQEAAAQQTTSADVASELVSVAQPDASLPVETVLADSATVIAAESTSAGAESTNAGSADSMQLAAETLPETVDIAATTAQTDTENAAKFHIVQASESLYAISVRHNIRLQRLMDWNQLTPDSVIKTGQKIWLQPVSSEELAQVSEPERPQVTASAPTHTVVAGETMFSISYRYNVRLSSFMSWNNFTEQSKLQVGQQVYVIDPVSVSQ